MKTIRRRPIILLAGTAVLGATMLVLLQPYEAPPLAPPPATAASEAVPTPVPPPMPVAPPVVAASTAGLELKGVLGFSGGKGAAIFALPDGRQRRVAVGGDVAPGVRLEAIGVDRVTVHDGVQPLEFALPELRSGVGSAAMPLAAAPTPMPTQAPTVTLPDPKRDLANFRLGLKAEGNGKQPQGYRLTGAAPLPALEAAGLRPGDLVLAVNGQTLDQERLLELPAEMVAASSVTIDFERDGERMSTTLSKD